MNEPLLIPRHTGWHRRANRGCPLPGMPLPNGDPVNFQSDMAPLAWDTLPALTAPVIFVRGIPGIGKTTLAKTLFPEHRLFEADLYMHTSDGTERDFATRHVLCIRELTDHLRQPSPSAVICCNTFSRYWELISYIKWLPEGFYTTTAILALDHREITDKALATRNQHAVPLHVITSMRQRWEPWPGEILVQCKIEEGRTSL